MKTLIKTIITLSVLFITIFYFVAIFEGHDTSGSKGIFREFYSLEPNTVDVAYMGTSAVNKYWINPYAYEEYGIASCSLATYSQPFVMMKYIMEEVEKTQNPRLYIIELRGVGRGKKIKDYYITRVSDGMKHASNRTDAVNATLAYAKINNAEINYNPDYYLNRSSRYQQDIKQYGSVPITFYGMQSAKRNSFEGYYISFKCKDNYIIEPQEYSSWSEQADYLNPHMRDVFCDFLAYCDKTDKNVLFVVAPFFTTNRKEMAINEAACLAREAGYNVVNFNEAKYYKAIGLDEKTDFYNSRHTNMMGAYKFTDYFGQYLKCNYILPDRRGNSKYEVWEKSYKRFEKTTTNKYKKMCETRGE